MFDMYKIGITIALASNAAQVLGLMGTQFGRTQAQADALQKTLKNISILGAGGAALTGLGMGLLKSMEGPYQAAKRYEMAVTRFKALNLGDAVNDDADKFARGAKIIGASAKDVITNLTDLHTIFGDYEHAKAFTPTLSKMLFANKAVFGHEAKFDTKAAGNLGRVIEIRGGFKSPEEMLTQADMAQRVMTATGGRVGPNDMLAMLKTSGIAGALLSNKAFYYGMEPLIQELGGSRVGTSLRSAYQNLIQGRTPQREMMRLIDFGLLDKKDVVFNKSGLPKSFRPGSLKGSELYVSNPIEWMDKVMLPAFAKKGITRENDVMNAIGSLFSNPLAGNLFTQLYRQHPKIMKNIAISENAEGIDALHRRALTTPAGREEALGAAYENLKAAWGRSFMPLVLDGLTGLTKAFNLMADFAERNPETVKWITRITIGVGVLATVFGVVAMVAAGVLALGAIGVTAAGVAIGAAVVAVGAAIVYFWDEIKGVASASWEGVKSAWSTIIGVFNSAVEWVMKTARIVAPAGLKVTAPQPEVMTPLRRQMYASAGVPIPGSADGATAPGAPPPRADGAIDLAAWRASQSSQPIQVTTEINMDGRRVAQAVTQHQAREASGPLRSTTSFDTRRDYTPTVSTAR